MVAGDKEIILASEEAQVKNINMILNFSQETRQMMLELRKMHDALQNKMMAMDKMFAEQRKQLSSLQQLFYAKGTPSYNDGD